MKRLSTFTYVAIVVLVIGVITKLFLTDTNLGARFGHRLLSSDILLAVAVFLFCIGQVLRMIGRNSKEGLKTTTIRIHLFLLTPMLIVLVVTPFLETFLPEKSHGDNFLVAAITGLSIIGTLALFAWIILFLVTIINRLFIS